MVLIDEHLRSEKKGTWTVFGDGRPRSSRWGHGGHR